MRIHQGRKSRLNLDDDEYVSGKVYDSRDGKTYDGKLWLSENNSLKMRGYVGVFFKTETWTRIK